jgi:Flp pilus assembly protein TadG
VETALCLCFVVLPLVFGIMAYAYMLSFRQTVSQSAAEGARAAAVAPISASDTQRQAAAFNAVNLAIASGASSRTCNDGILTCTYQFLSNCGDGTTGNCVKITVSYPYRSHSLLPSIPGLGFTLPSTISYSATAQVG